MVILCESYMSVDLRLKVHLQRWYILNCGLMKLWMFDHHQQSQTDELHALVPVLA